MKCVEIGHGNTRIGPDWVNVSAKRLSNTDVVCSWGEGRLPFSDEEFDIVYASHCLEHIPWYKTIDALKEARRVAKNGGVLEVWVPDFQYIVNCYHDKVCGDIFMVHDAQDNFMRWLNGKLFCYERDGHQNLHRATFDREYLEKCMIDAGFKETVRLDKPRTGNHPMNSQIGVGGVK